MSGMDFQAAAGRVRSLIAAKKPGSLSESGLTPDALRDNIIRDTEARSPRFQSHTKRQPEITFERTDEEGNVSEETTKWDSYGDCVRDVARGAFGWDEPQVRPTSEVKPSRLFNRQVIQHTFANAKFQEARPYTRGNELESIYGAAAIADVLEQHAQEVAQHVANSEEMREAEQAQQSAEDMFESLRQRARQEIAEQGEVQPGTKRDIKQTLKKIDAAGQQLGQAIQNHYSSNYVQQAAQIGQEAAEAFSDAVETITSLPGQEPGTPSNLPPDKQIELAERWGKNKDLREILRMTGRLVRDMRFKRSARTRGVPIYPVGVTTGRELSRLLPHEMARGYMPAAKLTFMKDYAARSLLEYDMEGKVPAGKGPIISVRDGSGSMQGEKFIWSTSLDLAMLTMALREKRSYVSIEFGTGHELKSWYFPKGEDADHDKILECVTHFFGGGTDTTLGLAEAHRILTNEPEFKTADIILIADGQDTFAKDDADLVAEFDKLGARVHGISVLCKGNRYMAQACEYVVDVVDLAGSNEATDALSENIT